jgi:hypothetical protein
MIKFEIIGMPDTMKIQIMSSLNSYFRDSRFQNYNFNINIFFNHQNSSKLNKSDVNILLLWEPEVFMPEQYRNNNMKKYNLVIPFNKDRANRLNIPHFLLHPHNIDWQPFESKKNKKLIAFVSAKKFSASNRSMYGFRRRVLRRLNSYDDIIDIYGPNWNDGLKKELKERLWVLRRFIKTGGVPDFIEALSDLGYKYRNYQGLMGEKHDNLSNYRFSLIIENDLDSITEKIFESIECKNVPVYVGAPLDEFTDLRNCVIEVKPDLSLVEHVILNLNDEVYNHKISMIEKYEKSNSIDKVLFSSEYNWTKLAKIIDSYLSN